MVKWLHLLVFTVHFCVSGYMVYMCVCVRTHACERQWQNCSMHPALIGQVPQWAGHSTANTSGHGMLLYHENKNEFQKDGIKENLIKTCL